MPRGNIKRNSKPLSKSERTKEESYEKNLYERWHRSQEKKALEKYDGKLIEEVPEEYREKIAKLREFGLGISKKKIKAQDIGKATFDTPVDECDKVQAELDSLIQAKENSQKGSE